MPDEVMERISFSMPWQYGDSDAQASDPDGFPVSYSSLGAKEDTKMTKDILQATYSTFLLSLISTCVPTRRIGLFISVNTLNARAKTYTK